MICRVKVLDPKWSIAESVTSQISRLIWHDYRNWITSDYVEMGPKSERKISAQISCFAKVKLARNKWAVFQSI